MRDVGFKAKTVGYKATKASLTESRVRLNGEDTLDLLSQAHSGMVPVENIKSRKLDKPTVSFFLASELVFLKTVAEAGGYADMAYLFDQIHIALIEKLPRTTAPPNACQRLP